MIHLDHVDENVWYELTEVIVVLRLIFGIKLQLVINYGMLIVEHIEDSVGAVIDVTKHFSDLIVSSLASKGELVDFVIELHLILVVFVVLLLELSESWGITDEVEAHVASDLGWIDAASDDARQSLGVKALDQVWSFFLVL